jgi:hypothetical protein
VPDRLPNYLLTTGDQEVLYTKTIEWAFEKEWRIIRSFRDHAENVGSDSYGRDVLLFDVPPSAVKSIILGYKTTPVLEKELRDIVAKNPALSHLNFRRAVREANGHIEIKPAPPSQ